MVLLVVKHKEKGILSISEYTSIKEAEIVYRKLFPDDFYNLVIVESDNYL